MILCVFLKDCSALVQLRPGPDNLNSRSDPDYLNQKTDPDYLNLDVAHMI